MPHAPRLKNWHIEEWREGRSKNVPESLHAKLTADFGEAGKEKPPLKYSDSKPILRKVKDIENE